MSVKKSKWSYFVGMIVSPLLLIVLSAWNLLHSAEQKRTYVTNDPITGEPVIRELTENYGVSKTTKKKKLTQQGSFSGATVQNALSDQSGDSGHYSSSGSSSGS